MGNKIDGYIRAGRYGQTNGIAQGSVLMDFIAELVLGFVDKQIASEFDDPTGFRILRYRDDYRIFANSDDRVEEILKVVSQKLMSVGMKLGVSKTFLNNSHRYWFCFSINISRNCWYFEPLNIISSRCEET